MTRTTRLAKLEAREPRQLSEAVRAWLGLRPPLSDTEAADHQAEEARRGPPDVSGWSPKLREWLGV